MSLLLLILIFNEFLVIFGTHYTDKWAVKIKGGEAVARKLSEKYGFIYLGKIIPDVYHFQHKDVQKRSAHPSAKHHQLLFEDPEVLWTEQQIVKRRVSRSMNTEKREFNTLYSSPNFPNDPKWKNMWYLNGDSDYNMRIRDTWTLGYTGKGVVVTVVDDGIEINHADLKQNYDAEASYDVNDHDLDPTPRYDYSDVNRHGTRCAGVVAAVANNNECAIGVAFNASIGGIRMLDGDVTDAVEAESLSFRQDYIDIYSASWGPTDNGRTVDGPGPLTWKAFENAINTGRNGLGNIFVWASGNGGNHNDNCNCDGYTNSIYTLSISGVSKSNKVPWFSESCSSTIATAAGSGNSEEKWLTTTDIRQSCTEYHSGTSASVAIGAGICALVLEANPHLTWRDMQHIVILAAKKSTLIADDWVKNGVGKDVSHAFGFGLMDSLQMVSLAKIWENVSPQRVCRINTTYYNVNVPYDESVIMELSTSGCNESQNYIRFLEHVQVEITIAAVERRGEIEMYITSPMGTRSTLLSRRPSDYKPGGFVEYPFMTVHSWGERPNGTWTLEIRNGGTTSNLTSWSLILMGTERDPIASLPEEIFDETEDTEMTSASTTTSPTSTQTIPLQERHDIVCGTSGISAVVPHSLFPGNPTVTWSDPSCSVQSNGSHFVASIGFHDCGTTVRFTTDTVIFENTLKSNGATTMNPVVDFGESSVYTIPIQCVYQRKENVTGSFFPIRQTTRYFEKRFGHLDLHMEKYTDDKFTRTLTNQRIPLGSDFFVKLTVDHLNRSDLAIKADNCVATPTSSPADSLFFRLLQDGCPSSSAVHLIQSAYNEVRFRMTSFIFRGTGTGLVYIHCEVSVCPASSTECSVGCLNRRKRAASNVHSSHLLSAGPILLVTDEGTPASVIVAAVCAAVAVVATVFAVIGWRRRRDFRKTDILH